jgi:hypothetical protein
MSKFIDMLEKIGQETPGQIGFGPLSMRQVATPQIILVARLLPGDLEKDPGLGEARADAFLVGPASAEDPALDALAESIRNRVWGVRLEDFDSAQAKQLSKRGCDFIVFESMATEAAVLNEEDLGKIVTVGSSLGEEVIRAVGELPVDGFLFGPALRTLPLTVQTLVDIQLVRGLVDKPFIVEAPLGLGQEDLEALRNLGIAGLIADIPPLDRIENLKEAADNLPKRRPRRRLRGALVPQAPAAAGPQDSGPDDDDEDGEDDF